MVETPQHYHASRRSLNHVIARAAREGRIFTRAPRDAEAFRHDGDVFNECELVTLEKLKRASEEAQSQDHLRLAWRDPSRRSPVLNAMRGRNAHGLLWDSGAALLSILGVIYPRDSVAEMAIARRDAGWSHAFRSNLERIDQYSGCGCEVVVTDPSTTCRPCGEISKVTVSPCGNGSAHSAVTTSLKRSRPQTRKLDRPPPMPETTVRYSKPPDRCRRKS